MTTDNESVLFHLIKSNIMGPLRYHSLTGMIMYTWCVQQRSNDMIVLRFTERGKNFTIALVLGSLFLVGVMAGCGHVGLMYYKHLKEGSRHAKYEPLADNSSGQPNINLPECT